MENKKQKIHFIGIGGIGVSALARYFLAQGDKVSGSDVAESEILEELRKLGAKIPPRKGARPPRGFSPSPPFTKGGENVENLKKGEEVHRAENVPIGTDLVIYSVAVEENNPELVEARRRGIKYQTYAEALGELTKKMWTIAVSGTHGKSTTTAMVGLILEAAGLDPTVIVGTKVKWNLQNPPQPSLKGGSNTPPLGGVGGDFESASNFRMGHSKYLVIEADEYGRSFLNYWPKIIVLTNIEEEHLDTYKNLADITKTFEEYVGHLKKDGVLIYNEEDKNISKLISNFPPCGWSAEERQFLSLREISRRATISNKNPKSKFQIKQYISTEKIDGLNLKILGQHNLSNAAAAITVAKILGIADKIAVKTLNHFIGTWRRMEYKGKINGAKIYDDYGHHPTEIKATLKGARELLKSSPLCKRGVRGDFKKTQKIPPTPPFSKGGAAGRLWCVFQPHQYQRTYKLFNHFIGSFADADKVILLPIYSVAGREKNEIKKKVSSEMLAEAIKMQNAKCKVQNDNARCKIIKNQDVVYLDSFEKATEYLKKNLKKGDICVMMGAGDIYRLTEKLICKNQK